MVGNWERREELGGNGAMGEREGGSGVVLYDTLCTYNTPM